MQNYLTFCQLLIVSGVTQDNLVEIIRDLAHKEIQIQKPQYVADCWGPIVSHFKLYFPNMCF